MARDERASAVDVPMASYTVQSAPSIIVTRGIGSCVVVTIYNPAYKIGGMAHYMLPYQPTAYTTENPYRFADFVIPKMIEEIRQRSKQSYLEAKIIGGADLFPMLSDARQTGNENAKVARKFLLDANVSIIGEHIGGNFGRSVWFDLDTGIAEVVVRL